jgi:cytidyltransferase-like protein
LTASVTIPADIFGGTFDPVQQGHLELIKSALLADRVLVVAPTVQNPWKERPATDLALRIEMLRIALDAEKIPFSEDQPHLGKVYLMKLEYALSVELLRWWRERYGSDIRWLVGPGDKASSSKWFNWDIEGCEVIEFSSQYPYHSTDIRAGTASAHPSIQKFIIDNHLYDSN